MFLVTVNLGAAYSNAFEIGAGKSYKLYASIHKHYTLRLYRVCVKLFFSVEFGSVFRTKLKFLLSIVHNEYLPFCPNRHFISQLSYCTDIFKVRIQTL